MLTTGTPAAILALAPERLQAATRLAVENAKVRLGTRQGKTTAYVRGANLRLLGTSYFYAGAFSSKEEAEAVLMAVDAVLVRLRGAKEATAAAARAATGGGSGEGAGGGKDGDGGKSGGGGGGGGGGSSA